MHIPYKVMTAEDAEASLQPGLLYADTETKGLYGRIRLLQLFQPHLDHVIILVNPPAADVMNLIMKYHTVWHNAHYDISTVQDQLGGLAFVPEELTDTLLLARLALPRLESHSLDSVMTKVLGFNPYAAFNKLVMQKSFNNDKPITEQQFQYAATDVWYLPQVYEACKKQEDSGSYQLDILNLKYSFDFQWNGMPVDLERLEDLSVRTQRIVDDIALPINCNSWQQVRPYIGSEGSDDITLATLALGGNLKADAVRKSRKAKKLLSFLAKFDTDVIFGKFAPVAKSGRYTCKDQNLQQLPRKSKGVFGVGVDEVMIFADYAQLELRTICAMVNCLKMTELFREGVDLHTFTAKAIFGDISANPKMYRTVAKTANFNLLYYGGVGMFITILIKSADILLSYYEAAMIKRKWLNMWFEINQWQQIRLAAFNRGDLGSTPYGRVYKADRMTDYMNIENQGAGADVAKLAIHYLHKYGFKTRFPGFKIRNFVHDSFIITGPSDNEQMYKDCAEFLAKCMQRAWFEMSKLFKVTDLPMPVEVAVGRNWGDIENSDVPNLYDFNLEPYDQLGVDPDAPI